MQRLLTQFERGSISDDACADDEGWTASVDSIGPRIDTHWTRILYYDLFTAERDDLLQEPERQAPAVTTIMRSSTELHSLAARDEASGRDALAPGAAPIVFLRHEPASNDAANVDPAPRRDDMNPWLQASVATIGFGAALETVAMTGPDAWEVHRAARAYRSYALGEIIVALVSDAMAFAREARVRWLQRRQAKAIHAALGELDDHALRDLGLHRSEIGSLAAEATGRAERTRMLALLTRNGFLM